MPQRIIKKKYQERLAKRTVVSINTKIKDSWFHREFLFWYFTKIKIFQYSDFFEKDNETTSFDQGAYAKGVPGSQGILIPTLCKLDEE